MWGDYETSPRGGVTRGSHRHTSSNLQWTLKILRSMMEAPSMVLITWYLLNEILSYLPGNIILADWELFSLPGLEAQEAFRFPFLPFETCLYSGVTTGNVCEGLAKGLYRASGREAVLSKLVEIIQVRILYPVSNGETMGSGSNIPNSHRGSEEIHGVTTQCWCRLRDLCDA